MATMFEVPQQALVEGVKEELKNVKEIQPPTWAAFVKTGAHRERVPSQEDWWHMRAASVLRLIALRGPIGVSKLRVKYGGKKNRGVKPERFRIASGNILRKVLQQLEKAGLAKQAEAGVHKGRVITPAGQKLLDKAATGIAKLKPKAEVKAKPEAKKEEKPKAEAKPKAEEKAKPEAKKKEEKPKAEAKPEAEEKAKPEAKKEEEGKKEEKPAAEE